MASDPLSYEIAQVMTEAAATGLFVSLCTISQPDVNPGYGGAQTGNYTNVTGLVNIPCMDAPPSPASLTATEVKALQEIMSKGIRHLLLNGYYPETSPDGQIPTSWRATVDGVIYDVLGVEHDSQNTQTRLHLQIVTVGATQ